MDLSDVENVLLIKIYVKKKMYLRMGLPPSFLGASHDRSTYLLLTASTVRAYGGPGEAVTKINLIILYQKSKQ